MKVIFPFFILLASCSTPKESMKYGKQKIYVYEQEEGIREWLRTPQHRGDVVFNERGTTDLHVFMGRGLHG